MGKIGRWCTVSFVAALLVGCLATSPVTDANIGREQPLVDLVMSGKVTGNTMLPYYETTKSVLCAILPLTSQGAEGALAKMLRDGVDINQRCRPDAGDHGLPLDVIVHWIGYASEPGTTYDPVKIKLYVSRAETLLQRGAQTYSFKMLHVTHKLGDRMTLDQVLKEASEYTDAIVGQKVANEQFRREAEKQKFFDLEAIAATLQIVGTAANNYAASRASATVPAFVHPQTAVNQRVADATLSLSVSRQVDPITEQKTTRSADVVDINPHERFPSSAFWGYPINGWIDNLKFTSGGTRESACQATLAAMSQRMSKDTSTGVVLISEQTGCYCQSKPRSGMSPNDLSPKGWLCTAYYKVKSTGKKSGDAGR